MIHFSGSDKYRHDNLNYLIRLNKKQCKINPGHHFIVFRSGKCHEGIKTSKEGKGTKGFNKTSIQICITGNSIFTPLQINSLLELCELLMINFNIKRVGDHGEFTDKKSSNNINMNIFREYLEEGKRFTNDIKRILL